MILILFTLLIFIALNKYIENKFNELILILVDA